MAIEHEYHIVSAEFYDGMLSTTETVAADSVEAVSLIRTALARDKAESVFVRRCTDECRWRH